MKHEVTIFSYGIDNENRIEARLNGVNESGTFTFESNKTGVELWEEVFCLQNAEGNPTGQKALPNLCSMTAGDIMQIDGKWVICSSIGWAELTNAEAELWKELDRRQRHDWARKKSESISAQPA